MNTKLNNNGTVSLNANSTEGNFAPFTGIDPLPPVPSQKAQPKGATGSANLNITDVADGVAAGLVIGSLIGVAAAQTAVHATVADDDAESTPSKTRVATANTQNEANNDVENVVVDNDDVITAENVISDNDVVIPVVTDNVVDSNLSVASTVNDSMSFNEAFASARAELGAGGVFVWHGKLYGTFYADEWNAMTPEQKAEYWSHINMNSIVPETETHYGTITEVHGNNNDYIEVTQIADDYEPEVEVLGVVADEDTGMISAGIRVDGIEAILVDVDGDQVFDGIVADFNGDGVIQDDEIIPLDEQITLQDVMNATGGNNDFAYNGGNDIHPVISNPGADMPDFVNDADAGTYMA